MPRRASGGKFQTRMVTILIQDVRSGETDHQLAEVKVPIKPAEEDPERGFWVDARDLVSCTVVLLLAYF